MRVDFLYSTDFYGMNAPDLSHTCMHMLCTAGEDSFVFNDRCYHQATIILADFHRLRDRMDDRHLTFYHELMGSLCLTPRAKGMIF